jgi:hypothetical protein
VRAVRRVDHVQQWPHGVVVIELVHHFIHLGMAWIVGLTIVYGIVESKLPPIVATRVVFASLVGEPRPIVPEPGDEQTPQWWGEVFIYCGYCVGFWIHGIVGMVMVPEGGLWWSFLRSSCLWIASLLVMRSVFDVEVIFSAWDAEKKIIDRIRRQRES